MEKPRGGQRSYSWLLNDPSPLTDEFVDHFLTGTVQASAHNVRVRALYTRKLLASLYPTPVRHVEERWSFGRWLEAARGSLGISIADVALAIDTDVISLERLERSDVPPWEFRPALVAELSCLFRVHIEALQQMFSKSAAVAHGHGTTIAAARSVVRDADARADSARRALDLYLAANASQTSIIPVGALDAVRRELEVREAFDLLGS